jgi:hypothetical protein
LANRKAPYMQEGLRVLMDRLPDAPRSMHALADAPLAEARAYLCSLVERG